MVFACFRLPAWFGIFPTLLLTAAGANAADTVETVQRAASEWAQLRTETVRLQTEWQWQRDSLNATLSGLQTRVTRLELDRDALRAGIDLEEGKTADVQARNEAARDAMREVETRIQRLVGQLVAIRPFLPPRLAEGLELPYRSIQDAQLGPAEHMQHIITIFNRCGNFNKTSTFAEQELALDGTDTMRLLEVLYFGLSHACAYDRSNHVAYLGRPGSAGWEWTPAPNAAGEVARLIAIHHEEADPAYLVIPARITDPFADTSPR